MLDLYKRCEDYFLLQDGEPPTFADAQELFTDVPPGKSPRDQFVLGAWQDGRLCAASLVLAGYPSATDWYLGLLLLDPAIRGQGLGRQAYEATERWSAARGAKRMLIAVLEENEPALRFWHALGFEKLRVTPRATFKSRSHVRIELARMIA